MATHPSSRTLLLAAALLVGVSATTEPGSWQVQGRLFGKPAHDGSPHGSASTDISGLACRPGMATRLCLIADDETQGAQIVLLKQRKIIAGDVIRLSRAEIDGKPIELDPEAVAYADGAFYVIGSHGEPRHAQAPRSSADRARANASRHLYRIQFAPGAVDMNSGKLAHAPTVVESAPLEPLFRRHRDLARFDNVQLDRNGLTIEGLSVARNEAAIGFRGPVIAGRAVVLVVPLEALFGKKTAPGLLKRLDLGRDASGHARGIRDMVAVGSAWLGIAGPVGAPDAAPGNYVLFRWDGVNRPALQPLDLAADEGAPEAIMPLEVTKSSIRMLLLFDGVANGAPIVVDAAFAQPGSH